MFKKNLYSFCALIALSCSAYAMLEDVSSLGEGKGDRNALRAPTASLSIDGQEPSEASSSSPASSVSSSLFPNDDAKQLSAELERLRTESEECGRLYAQLHLKHIAQDRELAVKKDEAKQLAAELEKLRTESEECGRLYAQLHLKHIAQDRE
ncbi:MAG: hypothetical protein K2Y08_05765, partial [Alphaproteobacteria bacterium]|nr:hypothetical protein [Alphaproteobacteria bacterium]